MERSRPSFDEDRLEEITPAGGESLNGLASRVLFGETLEEKLRLTRPDSIIYDTPSGKSTFQQIEPGRPGELKFARESEARPAFPRTPAMMKEESRGVLLHFFANHELLAAELMALALLKFPDAPRAFREGLANTLREEQIHTRWYVKRMQQCGITFGQYPLNRFFWDAVSTMACPLDYVSRLSLTFEQANLDYARHYSEILNETGDTQSGAILDRIYRDEISHVGYGLHWFRQWKNPDESDWEGLQKRLIFPLSPSRAKGNRTPFNAEGRREAGFGDDYIRALSLFERSKGRTPNVFYFNPEAENRIARHPAPYHPNKRVQSVISDLEILCAFIARKDDVLLLRKEPSPEHLAGLAAAGISVPEIEPLSDAGSIPPESLLIDRKINQPRPWSRSPGLDAVFSPIKNLPAGPLWREEDRNLFSKIIQSKALQEWMGPNFNVTSGDDLVSAGLELRNAGWKEAIIKRPFSTAGGGMKRILLSEIEDYRGTAMSKDVLSEGGLLLEPAHDRIFDFSIQYRVEEGRLRLLGFIQQIIAPSGQYRGSLSFPKFCSGIEEDLARFIMSEAVPHYQSGTPFTTALLNFANSNHYEGPLGVDAYLFRDHNNQIMLRTACEINTRYTMGRVALDLRRHIAPGFGLKLEIIKTSELPEAAPTFELKDGRLSGGSVILNEIDPQTQFAARITVAKQQAIL